MDNEQQATELIEAEAKKRVERGAPQEQTCRDSECLLLETVLEDDDSLPEPQEPKATPPTYRPRALFDDWDEERPSGGEFRPSYEALVKEDDDLN